jgi:hypothetical protein
MHRLAYKDGVVLLLNRYLSFESLSVLLRPLSAWFACSWLAGSFVVFLRTDILFHFIILVMPRLLNFCKMQ